MFELGAPVDAEEFRRAGFRVVDSSDSRVVVAFADDPDLNAFHERLDALEAGVPEGQLKESYWQFFDAIDDLRPLGPEDRVTRDLQAMIAASAQDDLLRLDVECWHPGDGELAADWLSDLGVAVETAGGRLVDSMVNDRIGLLLARVYLPANQVLELAELDTVARLDVLPTPALTAPGLFDLSVDDIPPIQPSDEAPIVGVVDSGVASAHELLASSIVAADALGTSIPDGQDEHGHGTMVASILLHGDIQRALARGLPLRPICRVVSARVLDSNSRFPVDELWERDLAEAIEWCAGQGAKIINLSVGDDRYPFDPPRQMSAAAVVDDLARRLGLVVVVASGNSHPLDYLPTMDESSSLTYPEDLLASGRTRLIDPATSLLALTVGGITDAHAAGGLSGRESVSRVPMGAAGWPSPITRVGPGPGGAVKPELVERSGTLGIEEGRLISNDAELGVIGARAEAGRLLCWDVGTSYAAPIVSRVSAAVRARHPTFSPELVRALTLLSSARVAFSDELDGAEADRRAGELRLVGFGRPSIRRAIESSSHRAVLVADGTIPVNGVHVYELPVPSSFLESGGRRGIDIALAYSPRTRVRRLDYMATRMEFHLTKGLSIDQVADVFARIEGEDLDDGADSEDAADDAVDVGQQDCDSEVDDGQQDSELEERPPTPSELGANRVDLRPPSQARSRGANQLGRKVFHRRLQADRDSPMFLVVRNVNRWHDPDGEESYWASRVALA